MSVPIAVACIAVTVLVGTPPLIATERVVRGVQASAAADAAALAAADAALGWIDAEPCVIATEIAVSAGAQLQECTVESGTGVSRVTVVRGSSLGAVSRSARAGPPEIIDDQ